MEAGAGGRAMVLMMMVLVVATMTGSHRRGVGVQAQLDCASKLVSCANAISNTSIKPGKECCSALADAVKNELKCLCDVYNSPSIFQNFNINATRALEIPGLCGVSGDLSRCKSVAPAPSPSSSAAPNPASDKSPVLVVEKSLNLQSA
ncbi:non-specific lipid transfer protein GPI-anchored 7-like isoform X2 [Nymphaea colorata]|uniref:non-specific lipid transfer protein GPI-anchored 7-like isoform X2 n=1 Tax=Nymphaea colorata TaxID=210225 RepID=UPI00129E1506|nr:non-specific lipid transfer protein GPI-anchored 7-like isoform X2 [Nymphaea colorata]